MRDIEKIKEKYLELFYENYYNKNLNENFPALTQTENGTYFYADIDYNSENMNTWFPSFHYIRIETELVKSGKERISQDEDWRNRLIGALKYWVDNDFLCPNWWYNQIHMPRAILSIAIILNEYLSNELKDGIEKIILRGSYKNLLYSSSKNIPDLPYDMQSRSHPYDWDGTNLLWSALVTILHALWTNDEKLLRFAAERLSKEIKFTEGSGGVQKDGAFCLHGVRWYTGGYGREFVFDGAPLIYILGDTSFELSEDKIDVFLTNILDGTRCMMRNGYYDFNSMGRLYASPENISAGKLIQGVRLISKLDNIPRKQELEAFKKELKEHKENYETTKYYESVCQLCHKKDGVYIGVRGRTQGIRGGEGYASIGFLGYNTSYGTLTCYMESGQEYFNVAPFWDYSKLPGTTAREETESELQNHGDWTMERETECIASGIANNDSGILTEKAVHDGISVQTAFFVFGSTLVALGTDIQDSTPEKGRLFTTVEQCRAKDVIIEKNYVKKENVIYKNLGNTDFITSFEEKEGSWKRNFLDGSEKILKDDILTISISVKSGDSYAYMIFKEEEPEVEVLKNDKNCQAIRVNDTVMAVFHADGDLIANGKVIKGKQNELIIE